MRVSEGGHSKNTPCEQNLINKFILPSLRWYLWRWTIAHGGYHPTSSQCCSSSMVYYILLCLNLQFLSNVIYH